MGRGLIYYIYTYVTYVYYVQNPVNQLMVNWWFGLVVWDSRGTPK